MIYVLVQKKKHSCLGIPILPISAQVSTTCANAAIVYNSQTMKSLLFLSLLAFSAAAQQSAELDRKLSEKIVATLKQSGAASVSIAVVKDGELVFAKAFGMANIAGNRAADVNTRYAVGSISKQFTATAILLLAEQGKLSLDDKVSKYFPDLTRAGEVSIRQLLSHTSGYEDYAPQDYIIPEWTKPTTPQAILDRWAKKLLNFDPGTRWQYSNTNYVLAGEIFENVSGRPLVEFLREKIFGPLDMRSAGDCAAPSATDAIAYTRYALGPARPAAREASGWYFAAGELCMTPSDLARWDIAFLQKRILPAGSYHEITGEVRLANGDFTHYALGLETGDMRGIPTIYHGGEVSGFLALNTVFPTRNGAIVTLSNEDGISLIEPLSRQIATLVFSSESRRRRRRIPGRCGPFSSDCRKARWIVRCLPAMRTRTSATPRSATVKFLLGRWEN